HTTPPQLTDHVYAAQKPGHVVNNAGRTLLFSDGDGMIQEFNNGMLTAGTQDAQLDLRAEPDETVNLTPHHGVEVALEGGGMVHLEGTDDERSSIVVVNAEGKETARIETGTGVHVAAVTSDGEIIYQDRKFTKIASPGDDGRMGNQAGSEHSPVVLADYKVDPDAELERPTRIALIDTDKANDDAISLVDVEASYSFRSLGRGP